MTDEELEQMTDEQRAAWIGSLNADETLILNIPTGHRYTFLIASYIKRWLATEKMTVGLRLEMLEGLSRMADGNFGSVKPEALALIKPADDISTQIIEEARKLDTADDGDQRSFDILTSWETFGTLVRANPSIMDAIRLRH
jgi:hypothetical protein